MQYHGESVTEGAPPLGSGGSRVPARERRLAVTEQRDETGGGRRKDRKHASQSRLADPNKGFSATARQGETPKLLTEAFPLGVQARQAGAYFD